MKKIFYQILASIIILPFTFAYVFYANFSSFSVSEPLRAPYLKDSLGVFFPLICSQSPFAKNALVTSSEGCTFNFEGKGIYTDAPGSGAGYYIKKIDIGFESYTNGKLNLRYHVLYDWVNLPDKIPDEYGIITFDLSLTKESMREMIFSVNPYISANNHLIEKIKERPNTGNINQDMFSFPSVLSFLTFQIFNIQTTGKSISLGLKFPHFTVLDRDLSFLRVKKYFEEGELQYSQPGRFLSYSISNFTSFGVSDIYPRTSNMKVLCSLETLFGMLIFGVISAFVFEWILEKRARP